MVPRLVLLALVAAAGGLAAALLADDPAGPASQAVVNDQLDGGLGADVFNGQAGNGDVAYYAGRAESFVISSDGVANDGSAGGTEGDNVGLDVEHITSGSGNDVLTGDADINTMSAGRATTRSTVAAATTTCAATSAPTSSTAGRG